MIVVTCDGPDCRSVSTPPQVFQNEKSSWIVRSDVGGNALANHFCSPRCEVGFVTEMEAKLAALLNRNESDA